MSDPSSFDHIAGLYERVRPEYPAEAVSWLLEKLRIPPASTVLDLGAGTGKLTRALVPHARRVIAVDPGPKMLAELSRVVPDADALLGSAEAIPLADDSVHAVLCGQSFHWFRQPDALLEIHRVLRRGGGLGVVWNVRDPDDELQQLVSELIAPFVPPGRPPSSASVQGLVDAALFGPVEKSAFRFEQQLDGDSLAARIASISFVSTAPETERERLEHGLRELAAGRGGVVSFRYRTEAYVTFSAA